MDYVDRVHSSEVNLALKCVCLLLTVVAVALKRVLRPLLRSEAAIEGGE